MKKKVKDFHINIDRSNKSIDIPTSVVKQIIEHISSGHLQPGDKLPSELEMTRRFGISRISLREALKTLEAKGFIECLGRRGKFVKSTVDNCLLEPITDMLNTDFQNLQQFMEAKGVIIGESAFLAANRAHQEQINKMKDIIDDVLNTKNNLVTYEKINKYFEFYSMLSDSTQNKVFTHMLHTMSSIFKEILLNRGKKFFSQKENTDQIFNHLKEILTAIENKNGEQAKMAMHRHTDFLSQNFAESV